MKRIVIAAAALSVCAVLSFAAERTKVRWFIGLGAGSDVPTFAPQKAVVDKFNASQSEIELVMEIVESTDAPNVLATQLSGGNAPDIVGPVGIRAAIPSAAPGSIWPLVKKHKFDLSKYDKATVDFFRDSKEGLVGLPFRDLSLVPLREQGAFFEEAGLPLPRRSTARATWTRRARSGSGTGHGQGAGAQAHRGRQRQRRHEQGF
jgi:multiple sugar transport system substrate-binding protein